MIAKYQAGYSIRNWQEITDQVREMIVQDSCDQVLKAKRGGNLQEMKTSRAFVSNTSLQATESNQMKSEKDHILDNLLKAPLSEEGFGQILSIIYERQRAESAGKLVLESPRSPNEQPGDVK